jgi:hypothetical protein
MARQNRRRWGVAGALLVLWLLPSLAAADSLIVQTKGHQALADPGTSGFSHAADLSVVITTHGGSPVTNLGPSVIGDGSNVISLPTAWTLEGNFTRPPGGMCARAQPVFQYGERTVCDPGGFPPGGLPLGRRG